VAKVTIYLTAAAYPKIGFRLGYEKMLCFYFFGKASNCLMAAAYSKGPATRNSGSLPGPINLTRGKISFIIKIER
jgi:hypothetical protein